MKCRRCKTSFDYDACYGICPKCAAYNRPDGKDEMKTVMGEDAGSFEEEYHPPVMSTGEAGDFLGMDEPAAHRRSKNKNNGKTVIVPYHTKELKTGLEQAILKQAGLK